MIKTCNGASAAFLLSLILLPPSVFGTDAINNLESWTIKNGDWTVTDTGAFKGAGDSELELKNDVSANSTISFQFRVLDGMRPRIFFDGTGLMVGNEGYKKTIGIYGKNSEKIGDLTPYEIGDTISITASFYGSNFKIKINDCFIGGDCDRVDKINLRIRGGDGWSKGVTEFSNFKIVSNDPSQNASLVKSAIHDLSPSSQKSRQEDNGQNNNEETFRQNQDGGLKGANRPFADSATQSDVADTFRRFAMTKVTMAANDRLLDSIKNLGDAASDAGDVARAKESAKSFEKVAKEQLGLIDYATELLKKIQHFDPLVAVVTARALAEDDREPNGSREYFRSLDQMFSKDVSEQDVSAYKQTQHRKSP